LALDRPEKAAMKKTISFVEAVNPKDRALQTAIRAFSIIRFGGTLNSEEAKLFIDICSLALPMKYRFPRSVHEAMEKQVKESLVCSRDLSFVGS
jgi:hypothetical protein